MKIYKIFVVVLVVLSLFNTAGCATYKTIDNSKAGSPIFFSGTRLDIHAINNNTAALKKFDVAPPEYPLLDLPASFAFDLFLSPLTGSFAGYELLFHQNRLGNFEK